MTEQVIKIYTTVSGDTWDIIAAKTMQNAYNVDLLMQANMEYADIYVFSAGIDLIIPAEDNETQNDEDSGMPPWKQIDYDELEKELEE